MNPNPVPRAVMMYLKIKLGISLNYLVETFNDLSI